MRIQSTILALLAAVALAACGASKTEIKECALPGSTPCGGTCVNLQEDQLNCGACGTVCPAGKSCDAGVCSATCAAPLVKCGSGATSFCANTQADNANCGTCGNSCGAGLVCAGGTCAPPSCPSGLTDCSGSCRDLTNDRANCGTCGNACGSLVCAAGVCSVSCGPGLTTCGSGAASFCADTLGDPANCGGCGVACAAADLCVRGGCIAPATAVTFRGVRTGAIAISSLTGWTQCYLDLYSNPGTALAGAILNACNKPWVLVGCRATGAVNLNAAAMGHESDVFFVTGNSASGQNKLHVANGVAWYFDNNWSMGYVVAGDTASLNSCDTATTGTAAGRVCFHTGIAVGGYRCGTNTSLNSSTAFERIVFHAD
jgi:hypothetical protein